MIEKIEQQLVGPSKSLAPLFSDESVTDILINGTKSCYVEREGNLEQVVHPLADESALFHFIERLVVPCGRQIDAAAPYIDGRCLDGSRFNIVLAPLAAPGPLISIRKKKRAGAVPLSAFGPSHLVKWIRDQVRSKKNFLISGGTGSGKTTLLSSLLAEMNSSERIVLIEEVIELDSPHPHLVHLEARAPSPEGKGGVPLRALVSTALRIRPDRIIVGECRGPEAFDMLQAMNTGHSGSLGTLHANSARDALRRFESLALLAGLQIPLKVIREWVASQIFGVIHLDRVDGKRCISEVLTVSGLEGEVYRIQPHYERSGLSHCNL
ncbi:MAG: CpaF family protein [Proteobacteria bacterium]|nr:CpaF family protein [Pseudomonadota bacterium]